MTDDNAAALRLARSEVVVRYVGWKHTDPETGGINGGAFGRTEKDVDGVSYSRRGIFADNADEDRAAIRQVVGSRLTLGKTAVFVELPVGKALDVLNDFEPSIFFVADPLHAEGPKLANPAHALLIGFPFAGEQVGSLKSEVAEDRLRLCIINKFAAVLPADPNHH